MTEFLKQLFIQNAVSSVKMAVIVLLLLCLTIPVTKRYRAGWRYYSWLAVIIVFMIPFQLLGITYRANLPTVTEGAVRTSEWVSAHTPMYEVTAENPFYRDPASYDGENIARDASIPVSEPTVIYRKPVDITLILAVIWALMSLAFFTLHMRRYSIFRKLIKLNSEIVTDMDILAALDEERRRMGINAEISVRKSPFTDTPMLTGFFKPLLLLPDGGFTADELRLILRHELTHYRRHDIWYQFILLIFLSLHWFNPVAYIMSKAVEIDGETSCDEVVLDNRPYETRVFYGEMLLKFLRITNQKRSYMTTTFFGGKKGMKKRLTLIASRKSRKKGTAAMAALLAVTIGASLTAAAAQPWDEEMTKFFNNPTVELMDMIDANVSRPQARAESNGTTVEVKQTITDNHGIYVLFDVTTPEGTKISDNVRWNELHFTWSTHTGISGVTTDILSIDGNKMTMLLYGDCEGIADPVQHMHLSLSDLVIFNDAERMETDGVIKEIVAECDFDLSWETTHTPLTKTLLPDEVVTRPDGNQLKIQYIDVSPMSVFVCLEGIQVLFGVIPVVHMKDGTDYIIESVNNGKISTSFSTTRIVDGVILGRNNFGIFFDNIVDITDIESITLGDVTVPISSRLDSAIEAPKTSDWSRETVKKAISKDYIPPTVGVYDYTKNITREQFCNIAVEAMHRNGCDELIYEGPSPFTDIQSRSHIEVMYTAGLINGKSDTIFAPDDELTREEAATILYRIAEYTEKSLNGSTTYADADEIADWAKDAAGALGKAGIMSGTGGNKFSPKDSYTVEQAIVTLVRLMEYK